MEGIILFVDNFIVFRIQRVICRATDYRAIKKLARTLPNNCEHFLCLAALEASKSYHEVKKHEEVKKYIREKKNNRGLLS